MNNDFYHKLKKGFIMKNKYLCIFILMCVCVFCYGQRENDDELFFCIRKFSEIERVKEELPEAEIFENLSNRDELPEKVLGHWLNVPQYTDIIKYTRKNENQKITIPELPAHKNSNYSYIWSLPIAELGRNDAGLGYYHVIFNDKTIEYDKILELENFIINYSNRNYNPESYSYFLAKYNFIFDLDDIKKSIMNTTVHYEIPFRINHDADSYFKIAELYTLYSYATEIVWNLMQLDKMQLRLLRNAFYASKGYVFKDKNLTDFFIQSEKYKPNEFIKENTIEFSQKEKDVLKIIIELENEPDKYRRYFQ